jgi:hypothetical protein
MSGVNFKKSIFCRIRLDSHLGSGNQVYMSFYKYTTTFRVDAQNPLTRRL